MTENGSNATTYIVIVNWNGWQDTIECLESVFRLRGKFSVIVCDNDSADGSIEKIIEWALGDRAAPTGSIDMRRYTEPPVPKPIQWACVDASRIAELQLANRCEKLLVIKADRNLGFAGGNNLGLRYILRRNDHDFVWLLNNDTVVDPEALENLVARMKEDPKIGICGSKLCFYSAPHLVQAYGGATYSPVTGRNRHIGICRPAAIQEDRISVERKIGYIVGASMFITRDFLSTIGLMNEEYFLYNEEIDWATRAKGRFLQSYAPGSIVFHKQGNSMGGNWLTRWNAPEKSFIVSDYYSIRNQIRFTRRYYPQYLPIVAINVAWRLAKRVMAGKRKRAWSVLRGASSAFSGKLLDPVSQRERDSIRVYASD